MPGRGPDEIGEGEPEGGEQDKAGPARRFAEQDREPGDERGHRHQTDDA